jgi:hypothetical protein
MSLVAGADTAQSVQFACRNWVRQDSSVLSGSISGLADGEPTLTFEYSLSVKQNGAEQLMTRHTESVPVSKLTSPVNADIFAGKYSPGEPSLKLVNDFAALLNGVKSGTASDELTGVTVVLPPLGTSQNQFQGTKNSLPFSNVKLRFKDVKNGIYSDLISLWICERQGS